MDTQRIPKSIKLSATATAVIEQLRVVKGTKRKLSFNSVVESLIESSPKFKKELVKIQSRDIV